MYSNLAAAGAKLLELRILAAHDDKPTEMAGAKLLELKILAAHDNKHAEMEKIISSLEVDRKNTK